MHTSHTQLTICKITGINERREYSTRTANIPVLGMSLHGHSMISLASASVFIATELRPTGTYVSHAIYMLIHNKQIHSSL